MRPCGGQIRQVLLIQQILLCLLFVLGHDHDHIQGIVEAAPIRIAAPMDGWVLTETPVFIKVLARRPFGKKKFADMQGSCFEIYLDGKVQNSTDSEPSHCCTESRNDSSTQWTWETTVHVRESVDDGPHEVEVWQKFGGFSRLADSSAFFLHRGKRGSVWPWFAGSRTTDPTVTIPAWQVRQENMHEKALAEDPSHNQFHKNALVRKSAVILYHMDIYKRYPARWVNKCIASIMVQTYQEFDVFELNFGAEGEPIFGAKYQEKLRVGSRHYEYHHKPLDNHAEAMNELLNLVFQRGYDVAFNVNIDDSYPMTRFLEQMREVEKGADIVASYFTRIEEREMRHDGKVLGVGDVIYYSDEMPTFMHGSELFGMQDAWRSPTRLEIADKLAQGNNVLCHPGIAFGRRFWNALSRLECKPGGDGGMPADGPTGSLCLPGVWGQVVRPLRYRPELPLEDLLLWQRAIATSDISVHIVPSMEVYYRIHEKSVSHTMGKMQERKTQESRASNFQGRLRVGILTVCTGESAQYLERHLRSVASLFMRGLPKFFYVYTDDVGAAERVFRDLQREYGDDFAIGYALQVEDQGYDSDKVALMRFHRLMLLDTKLETETDYVFYMGVDTIVHADIAVQEVLPEPEKPLVDVCRAFYRHGSLPTLNLNEENTVSTALAGHRDNLLRKCWITGGFLGGRTPDFVVMARAISEGVDSDLQNGSVTADGCDEDAHLNKHFATFPEKYRTLAPSYMHPGTVDVAYEPRIVVAWN